MIRCRSAASGLPRPSADAMISDCDVRITVSLEGGRPITYDASRCRKRNGFGRGFRGRSRSPALATRYEGRSISRSAMTCSHAWHADKDAESPPFSASRTKRSSILGI